MKAKNIILMSAVAMITLLATCQTSTAYFWTGNPGAFEHDDEPPQGAQQDGILGAELHHYQGTPVETLITTLFGNPNPNQPSIIIKTDAENGLSCVWYAPFYLYVERFMGTATTKCEVTLQLYHKNHGQGNWVLGDTETENVIVNFNDPNPKEASGWLYVWIDCDYDDTDQFQLKATAKCQYFNGQWINIGTSPRTNQVYFEIDEV